MATRSVWQKRVEQWKSSGVSAAEFAERHGWRAQQLYWWSWKLGTSSSTSRRDEPASALPEEPRFLPVRVMPSPSSTLASATTLRTSCSPSFPVQPIEVTLPNGCVVRVQPGFDVTTLAQVLALAAEVTAC